VDLILHPLRSELHWPLGRRVPLDFSKSKQGDGLRWKLPFFIIDAVFGAGLRRSSSEEARGSNEALEILKKITACVKGATQKKSVQSQPHLVLLDKTWYNTSLSPLLAEWTEIWLRARGASRGIAEHHMRAYLTRSGNVAGTFCVSQIQRLFQAPL
jgi:hypothetical protein